jgi:hypothetical protein
VTFASSQGIFKLEYCRLFYPFTKGFEQYCLMDCNACLINRFGFHSYDGEDETCIRISLASGTFIALLEESVCENMEF